MDTLNKPLNLNNEHWDLFATSFDEHNRDWESDESFCAADLVDPSTINAFETHISAK